MPVVGNLFIWDPWFYVLAVPVVLLVGISKGGFGGGVGLVAVPLLSIVMPLPQAAAILLPILCVMDLFAVSAYWGEYSAPNLRRLLPGGLVGIACATLAFGAVVFYIESRRFLIRDSPRPATTYEQKTGGADGVKGA